jgi:carboxymethylenebutenolidase
MRYLLLSMLCVLMLTACQSAPREQDNATTATSVRPPITGTMVPYFGNTSGYYAAPTATGNYPGIILIHEWWGLNDQMKQTADKLAAEGYRVLAVDLYHGVVAQDQQQAMVAVQRVNEGEAIANMKAAKRYLQENGAPKVASWGYCFGGGQSMQLALAEDLDATVIYYGQLVNDPEQVSTLEQPFLLVYGAEDTATPAATAQEFKRISDEQGRETELYVYEGVGHAFANPSNPQHDAQKTADAWGKTLTFLEKHLSE